MICVVFQNCTLHSQKTRLKDPAMTSLEFSENEAFVVVFHLDLEINQYAMNILVLVWDIVSTVNCAVSHHPLQT